MNGRNRISSLGGAVFTLAVASSMLAQTAAPTNTSSVATPKAELFLGYSRFGVGFNSTTGTPGNRMVNLNGGTAAAAYNFTPHFAVVADFSGYGDSMLRLAGTGGNLPRDVNSSGTVFTYLAGPRLTFLRLNRLSAFAQVLAGGIHASQVTVDGCVGSTCVALPTQNALAVTAGGGLDIRLTRLLALRPIQAEYMMTRFSSVTTSASSTQNDLRLSSGLVLRFGAGQAAPPVQLSCSVQPQAGYAGDVINVTSFLLNPRPKHPAVYRWTTTAGILTPTSSSASVNTAGLAPGTYTVMANVSQGNRPQDQASCNTTFTINAPLPPTIACSASPSTVLSGATSTITTRASSPQARRVTYSYAATSGSITGNDSTATLSTTGVGPGMVAITCTVIDDLGQRASAPASVKVTVPPPTPAVIAARSARELCAISFERDRKRSTRVDNQAKACLDDVALQMQRDPNAHLAIVPGYSVDEKPAAADERAKNERSYLTVEKGIDTGRIELRTGLAGQRTIKNVIVPEGTTY